MAENSDAGVVRQLLLPLDRFLKDESLYEVVINRPGEVLTEGTAGWKRHELPDLSFDKLMRLARAVASYSNQGIDETRPLLSATLPDDERIQIVIPPATTRDTVSITSASPHLLRCPRLIWRRAACSRMSLRAPIRPLVKIRC